MSTVWGGRPRPRTLLIQNSPVTILSLLSKIQNNRITLPRANLRFQADIPIKTLSTTNKQTKQTNKTLSTENECYQTNKQNSIPIKTLSTANICFQTNKQNIQIKTRSTANIYYQTEWADLHNTRAALVRVECFPSNVSNIHNENISQFQSSKIWILVNSNIQKSKYQSIPMFQNLNISQFKYSKT